MSECMNIACHKDATLELELRTTFSHPDWPEPKSFDSVAGYCDDDFGWFYRSMSRRSYDIEILGINVLLDCDKEFGR